jgi:hypothetical protein
MINFNIKDLKSCKDALSDNELRRFFNLPNAKVFSPYNCHRKNKIQIVKDVRLYCVCYRVYIDFKLNSYNDLPSEIIIQNNDNMCFSWHKNGVLNRIQNPAFIEFYNGFVCREAYFINGKYHNRVGPAFRAKDYKGSWYNHFYINDKKLTLDEFIEKGK